MANGKVSIDINDEQAFRGYVVSKLEDIIDNSYQTKEKVDGLDKKVGKLENTAESIIKIKKTLFGNGKEGLVIEVKKLKLSHKIKSSMYGCLGGGGFACLITLLYFLLRGKV